jgi:hypothetical protein
MPVNVSIFSQDQLKAVVDDTLKATAIPDGHKNAIVGTVDQDGAKAIAVFKLGKNDNWLFQGAFTHDWASGDNKVGASVLYSW